MGRFWLRAVATAAVAMLACGAWGLQSGKAFQLSSADLEVIVSGPLGDTMIAGDFYTPVLFVRNPGPDAVSDVIVTWDIPDGMNIADRSQMDGRDAPVCTARPCVLSFGPFALAPGEAWEPFGGLGAEIMVDPARRMALSTIVAAASSTVTDPNPANNAVDVTFDVEAAVDLAISVDGAGPVAPGNIFTFAAEVSSVVDLRSRATGVTVRGTLPPVFSFEPSLSDPVCTITGNDVLECELPDLWLRQFEGMPFPLEGESFFEFTLGFTLNGSANAGDIAVEWMVSATEADPDPTNNSAIGFVTVGSGETTTSSTTTGAGSGTLPFTGGSVSFVGAVGLVLAVLGVLCVLTAAAVCGRLD